MKDFYKKVESNKPFLLEKGEKDILFCFLKPYYSNNFSKLAFNKNDSASKSIRICLSHAPLSLDDPKLENAIELINSVFPNKADQEQAKNCLLKSSSIFLYFTTAKNAIYVLSLCNFTLTTEGVFVNWLVTSKLKYTQEFSSGADNLSF